MTTHQAIAMAFPVLTTFVVGLFAYGLTKWIGRKKTRQPTFIHAPGGVVGEGHTSAGERVINSTLEADLEEAHRIINRAQRKLQKA